MKEYILKIKGMSCEHCRKTVESALLSIRHVRNVVVDLEASTAIVLSEDFMAGDLLVHVVEEAGYQVESVEEN